MLADFIKAAWYQVWIPNIPKKYSRMETSTECNVLFTGFGFLKQITYDWLTSFFFRWVLQNRTPLQKNKILPYRSVFTLPFSHLWKNSRSSFQASLLMWSRLYGPCFPLQQPVAVCELFFPLQRFTLANMGQAGPWLSCVCTHVCVCVCMHQCVNTVIFNDLSTHQHQAVLAGCILNTLKVTGKATWILMNY